MSSIPKRVLIADNDRDVLDATKFGLTRRGYTVVTASSLEQAKIALTDHIIHAAIIDIRLGDRPYGNDESGIQLVRHIQQRYPYIPFVIFTTDPNSDRFRRVLAGVGAKDYFDKTERGTPIRLFKHIDQLFAEHVKINFGLSITGSVDLARMAGMLGQKFPGVTVEDLQEILCRLFLDAESVQLDPLGDIELPSEAGSIVFQGQARSKTGARQAPVVVKFNSEGEIQTEVNNFKLITPFLGGQRFPQFQYAAYARQTGGFTSSLLGMDKWETISTFSEFFQNEQIASEAIVAALELFWGQTFGTIHYDAKTGVLNLTDLYTKGLHLTPQKVQEAAREICPDTYANQTVSLEGLDRPLFNPFVWGLPDNQFRQFTSESRSCLCHGDLHCNNILVDSYGFFWLIDFARVEKNHHLLRDFVELEADIKFRLLTTDVDLEHFLLFEQALLDPAVFTTPETKHYATARLDRGYEVISSLRRTAAKQSKLAPDVLALDYARALFFQTLKFLVLSKVGIEKKRCAVLSASLLAEYLDQYKK